MKRLAINIGVLVLLIAMPFMGQAQWLDGGNFDFSNGDYSGWKGWQGKNSSADNAVSTINITNQQTANDLTTLNVNGTPCFQLFDNPNQSDPLINNNQLKVIPPGYTHSSRINCNPSGSVNGNTNTLTYDLIISPDNCLITFNYSMILESPGHQGFCNPFFKIDVIELDYATDNEIGLVDPCATFYALGQENPVPPGFQTQGYYIWQNWRQVSMNLADYEGSKVRLKAMIASCCYQIHIAYGYFVGEVGAAELTVNACGDGDTVAVVEAPPGFQKYEWISRPSDFTDYPDQFGAGPIIHESTATAEVPADNTLVIRQSDPYADHQFFVVKLTSPSSSASIPGCEAYIKARVQSMKPNPDFNAEANCDLEIEFEDRTVFGSGYDPVADTVIYEWDFGDGETLTYNSFDPSTEGNTSPTHRYPEPGEYTVTLKVTDDYCSTTITQDVIVPETPDFKVKDSMICIGDQMTVHILEPSMPNAVYEWREVDDVEAPTIYVGNAYTATFNEEKTFWITASEENTECTRTQDVTISVQGFPEIDITGDTLICEGNSTTLTAIDNSGLTQAMEWTLNKPSDPPVMTNPSSNPTYTITPSANTTVYLIARTSQGCLSWKGVDITVIDPVVYASQYRVCPGDKVTLYGEKAIEYSWTANPDDPTLTTDKSPEPAVVFPEETTVYTMRGYAPTGCYSERTVKITVVPFPIAKITYSPDFIDTDNPVVSLKDDSEYGVRSKWDLSDGTTTTARSFTHRFGDVSRENVSIFLTTYNEIGDHCYDTASLVLPIQLFSVWIPNAFTPDEGGFNNKFFFYSLNELADVRFEIFNKWGTKLYSFTDEMFQSYEGMDMEIGWDGTYKGREVSVGTYLWRLTYRRPGNDRVYDHSGNVSLIR